MDTPPVKVNGVTPLAGTSYPVFDILCCESFCAAVCSVALGRVAAVSVQLIPAYTVDDVPWITNDCPLHQNPVVLAPPDAVAERYALNDRYSYSFVDGMKCAGLRLHVSAAFIDTTLWTSVAEPWKKYPL
jgi:hypothetical protein